MSLCDAATQAAWNRIGNGGVNMESSLGKGWAEDAGEGMADGLSVDACGRKIVLRLARSLVFGFVGSPV